jgi:hypothetical protein
MAVYDFFLSRNASTTTINNYVGHRGRLFYDDVTGNIRISDGSTLGGQPIPITTATNSQTGAVLPSQGLEVTDIFGSIRIKVGEGIEFDDNNNIKLKPATTTTLGAIKLGPGVILNDQNQIVIDSTGLDFSFGDFSATTQTGPSNTDAAYLSSINTNEDIVFASNGTGSISVVGEFNIFTPNGSIATRDPVFSVDNLGKTSVTTIDIENPNDLGLMAPLNVSINADGLTKTPTVVTGGVAQFTGRDNNTAIIILDTYGIDSTRTITGGEFVFRTGRGTNAIPVAVQTDDILGNVTAAGWASNGYGGLGVGGLRILSNENFTDTSRGSKLQFYVTPNGTITNSTVATIDENGITLNRSDAGISNTTFITFDTTHIDDHTAEGTLCWNAEDGTLNLHHGEGVVQQIGQELFAYVKNSTGATISNGICVRFDGAENNGEANLLIAPFQANGVYPSLYGLGITTQSFANNTKGRVCVWGKVRGLNTTGQNGETWIIGDILYASPVSAGGLTKVKPTSPNNVVPVAAVLKVDATDGEIFVRPTIEQKMDYGVFTRTTDFQPAVANTAYPITLQNTEIANGVSIGNIASRLIVSQSGLYQIDWTIHWGSAGGQNETDTWYTWLRKNGTDIPNSMRIGEISGRIPSQTISTTRILSLNQNDYIEIMIAVSNINVRIDAIGTTGFGPTTAGLEASVAQIQL